MNYYFMMDDKINRSFNFSLASGCFDYKIRKKPFEDKTDDEKKIYSYEYEYGPDSPDYRFYNFINQKKLLKEVDFSYDYYMDGSQNYFSEKFINLLKNFKLPNYITKELIFTMNGKVLNSPKFYYLSLVPYVYSGIRPTDFIDYDKTEQLPSKTESIVSRKLVLKNGIPFDMFKLGKVEYLTYHGWVVSESLKNAIEENSCNKGIIFFPIERAQEEFCKHTFKDFNELIKRKKAKIPGVHY
ncbi:hypothetical protein D8811_09535 [Streptococcus gordonii]|uniref:Immunity protein 43 domain-containing protein n=2 Tax=Streptococcus gordonii TaxID=1302 RepID=A0AB34S8E8_STRGN|nr:hypothetical protein [Streptococcus gordonii]KJQ63698.1 hypothetical protein TZ88_01342 [Streptococcus gordonii]RSJ42860.1 hypothetical protein D8817_09870 [Streptococcus gordonii]RSJ55128.1 hypothetical protein D8811_09535 [Streptococcus gordonii]RSK11462.1 hypothetical protein D8806_05630 [Streptococcus gordonii]